MKPKTTVYIDGFNLYYGAVQDTPYRWLDLDALCKRLLPRNDVRMIRYFTARVKARPYDRSAPNRQQAYLRALNTIPHLTTHFGQFKTNKVQMALVHPPPPRALVWKTEEKGSDVNIATHLMLDAFRNNFEAAAVISNDSDLAEPIRVVNEELGLPVGVVNPHRRNRPATELVDVAAFRIEIRRTHLGSCQFPVELADAKGTFEKPRSW